MAQTAITIIDALPHFISEDEHKARTSSTPESFADIPPVLRHRQVGVSVQFEPPLQELSPDELKDGTLYVIERQVQQRAMK
jgi:chloride channel, nucleotide-sensitive, 1A